VTSRQRPKGRSNEEIQDEQPEESVQLHLAPAQPVNGKDGENVSNDRPRRHNNHAAVRILKIRIIQWRIFSTAARPDCSDDVGAKQPKTVERYVQKEPARAGRKEQSEDSGFDSKRSERCPKCRQVNRGVDALCR
jgi:hypothetical protein